MIDIVTNAIDCQAVLASVANDDCGANLLFVGTTRGKTVSESVEQITEFLVYECYEEMAFAEMNRLVEQAKLKWPVKSIAIVHRMGKISVGEISIAVAVSGPHRKETFDTGQWLVEELKKKVPIWKQENGGGEKSWVHPGLEKKNTDTV